jgi:hypothetical protein
MKSPNVVERIIDTLAEQHPNADTELHYRNAFELLAATILSAQSTDERVNIVTPALFKKYADARTLAKAKSVELEQMIVSTGFFRQKSKALIGMAQQLVEQHGAAVALQFQHVFAGVRGGRGEVQQQAAIDEFAGLVTEGGEVGKPWLRRASQQGPRHRWHRWPRYAHHPDTGGARRAGDGGNRVGGRV